jgi:hypothetical protein
MADETAASIITLHQPQTKRAKTPAERSKAYRQRKKASVPALPVTAQVSTTVSESGKVAPVTPVPPATVASGAVTPSRPRVAPILLTASAFALAGGRNDHERLVCALAWIERFRRMAFPRDWRGRRSNRAGRAVLRRPALAGPPAGYLSCGLAMTFVFAVTAGIGFASVNIADVTLLRASRITPAVQTEQTALTDAMVARDRECKGGVGKFCREREAVVDERRHALDAAMQAVRQTADPQTQAAIQLVAWATHGALKPSGDDFAMLRLVLLALLPQIGGILLMVGRSTK